MVVLSNSVLAEWIGQARTLIDLRRVFGLADEAGIDMASIPPSEEAGFGPVLWRV